METLGQLLWVAQYRLSSRIATGGMAEVYVGRHLEPDGTFGPLVAVKKLLPHLVKDTSMVRMFLNEARITAQIHHPNVVRVLELGQFNGEPFIAMELLEGHTWADLRSRAAENGQRMPVGIAIAILSQACRGLDAAHKATDETGQPLALVHRDFTPDNIHVGLRGEVKVIDFGIAKTKAWGAGTEPGTLKGKFFYMSPEMILAKPVDHRADVFAAGAMLYEQLCGHRPFTGTSIDEVVMRIATGKPAPPSQYDPAVPLPLEGVCLMALNRDPNSRFQSLQELVEAIEAVGGEAAMASPEEVGAYVAKLFPEVASDQSPTAKARKFEAAYPAPPQISGGAPLVETVALPKRADAKQREAPGNGASRAAAPVSAVTQPRPSWGRRRLTGIGVAVGVAVAAAGVAGFFALRGPGATPGELLMEATQASPEDRTDLLLRLAKAPEATAAQLQVGTQMLMGQKAWANALVLVAAWIERDPKSLDARLAEAQAATEARLGRQAEAAAVAAAELAPLDARPDAAMARLRELQGDAAGALEAWTRAADKDKSAMHAMARKGYWLSQSGRLDEAARVLSAVLKQKKEAQTAAELGFVRFRQERTEEAVKLLRSAVEEAPSLLEGHYYLAAALFRQNDVEGARNEYRAADTLAGDDSRPLVGWCEMEALLRSKGQLDSVKQRIKERFPKEASGLITRCAFVPPE